MHKTAHKTSFASRGSTPKTIQKPKATSSNGAVAPMGKNILKKTTQTIHTQSQRKKSSLITNNHHNSLQSSSISSNTTDHHSKLNNTKHSTIFNFVNDDTPDNNNNVNLLSQSKIHTKINHTSTKNPKNPIKMTKNTNSTIPTHKKMLQHRNHFISHTTSITSQFKSFSTDTTQQNSATISQGDKATATPHTTTNDTNEHKTTEEGDKNPLNNHQHSVDEPTNFSEGGLSLARSHTNLVEVINGRSKRWLFDPKNKRKLHPQWMWHADEEVFDNMLAGGRGRIQSIYHDVVNTTRSFAYSVLLPSGYPDSVHSCYGPFSTWQFVETTFNQFIHVLCSQAMLSCVGLPTDTASAAGGAVAIRWIAKDGIAHFSKLFFTKRFAYQLDFRPKSWGLVSELFFIFGSAFELSTALLAKYNSPEWFLPLAAFGASLQSVAHLAWEATHATFNKYLSLRNNLADVTAKADSQMVMSELLGMTLGLFYINYFNEPWHLWAAFLSAVPLHLGSTYARLKAIKFGKLSSSRLLQHYNSYVQHRLGPTRLQPDVLPEDVLGATAEHIPPEIYTNKIKRLDYIKQKIEKSHLYNLDLQTARDLAVQTAAVNAAQAAAEKENNKNFTPPSTLLRPASVARPGPTPPNPLLVQAQKLSHLDTTATPLSQQQNVVDKVIQQQPAVVQGVKKVLDPIQELQAVQSIMSFATPEQFHYTDRKLGEWFDAKAWMDIYGYAEIRMCAPVDEAFENEDELFGAVSLFRDRHYLVNYRPSTNKIYLTFEEECEHDDLMQSLLVATRLAYDIRKHGPPSTPTPLAPGATPFPYGSNEDLAQRWGPYLMIRDALQWSLKYEDQITALLAEGNWDVDELTWPDTGTRVYWDIPNPKSATGANTASTAVKFDVSNIVSGAGQQQFKEKE